MTKPAKKRSKKSDEAQSLFLLYKKETGLNKKILQIKALLFSLHRKTDFAAGLLLSSLRTPDNKRLNIHNLNPIVHELQNKNLLIHDTNCNPLILHQVTTDALAENPDEILQQLNGFLNYKTNYIFDRNGILDNLCKIHLAAHLNNALFFTDENLINQEIFNDFFHDLITVFYKFPLDPKWIKSRHPIIQLYLLSMKLIGFYNLVNPLPPDLNDWISLFKKSDCIAIAIKNNLDKIPQLMSRLLQLSLLLKGLSYVEKHLTALSEKQYYPLEIQGALAFFKGDKENAIQCYKKAMKLYNVHNVTHEWYRRNLHGILYVLVLISQDASDEDLKNAALAIANFRKIQMHSALSNILEALYFLKSNDRAAAKRHYANAQFGMNSNPVVLPILHGLMDWTAILLEPEELSNLFENNKKNLHIFSSLGEPLSSQLYAELVRAHDANDADANNYLDQTRPLGDFLFLNILRIKQSWEYAIDQLQHILIEQKSTNQAAKLNQRRLIWLIHPRTNSIEVIEQSMNKSGKWNPGRPIALKRLKEIDSELDYLTAEDKQVINAGLQQEMAGWYNSIQYSWNTRATLKALIGHPLVFLGENRSIPIELVAGLVHLQIDKVEHGYHFSLSHFSNTTDVVLEKETTNRYRVIDFSDETVAICKILTEKGITVPLQAKDKVIEMICNSKSSIHIQSDIADDDLPLLPGDATPHVHILPIQDGIKLNLWIRPFGEQGAYCRASHGQRSLITTLQTDGVDVRKKVIRDFDLERSNLDSVINQCATLSEFDEHSDEWHFDSPENSLELLLELDQYSKNHPLIIEWPKGQTLRVKQSISSKNLSLSVRGDQYWFEYEGEVQIDADHALDIKKLLDLLDQSQGRFVPLGTGEFLALTDKFKKQLQELKTISDGNKIYHLSTASLRELSEDAGTFKEDVAWSNHLKKISAMEKYKPVIPSTLQAELRDYQVEGFSYLSRLAHWEIGACLADDMGLGKTIQAITLLLDHAAKGPCLVVAPTSVCFVWLEELAKFAPTLQPHTLYNAPDRKALIDSLGKMDILICSYGLLHQAGDLLLEKTWKMIILDEAQAIKNPETKRWKFATQLNSPCRIAMTGTPIENHLGELWSIFRFLNPGLLGSLPAFQQRFQGPIEKNQDPVAKRTLKNLVSPFILRRTKSEVLLELPPKIEQAILIEPTAEEVAFYEAVRMKALQRIQQLDQSENNTKRFSILAEISRLRQACCHSSLVDENLSISSSKIKTFVALAKNIIDNNHKALIFSQFVRYLDIIRSVLDQENIPYQYLDGATSIKNRKLAVEEFQAGKGDLFLISLKAGGTGLNLTAADYVIILDPWWNPAVEDQAADRAHRMGQLRPVTVYRLIMKNSIEEKIVTLHQSKKDLAADLLSGSDMAGKISEEELVGLISG